MWQKFSLKAQILPSCILAVILVESNKCLRARRRYMAPDTGADLRSAFLRRGFVNVYIVQRTVRLSAVVIVTQPPRCDGGVALPMDSRGGMVTTNKREKTDFCPDFWQVSHDRLPLSSPHSRNRIDIYDNGAPKSPASSSRYNFTRRVFRQFTSRFYQRLNQLFFNYFIWFKRFDN